MRHERAGMNHSDLRYQKAMRLDRVRAWMSLALPHTQIVHLGLSGFGTSVAHLTALIKAVTKEFRTEAAEIETTPIHERRHADRLRLEGIMQLAVEGKKLDTALRAVGMLIKLNGTMPIRVDDAAFVSDEAQGARGLSDDLIAEILASGRPLITDVPMLVVGDDQDAPPEGDDES